MDLRDALIDAGAWMDRLGLVPATSGNLSARRPDGAIWLSRSGISKGRMSVRDFLLLDPHGGLLEAPPGARPSAETALHLVVYRRDPTAGAVLHGHGLAAMVASRWPGIRDHVDLSGWELQKAFAGRTTHDQTLRLPVMPNDQDVVRLAADVDATLDAIPPEQQVPGFLIRGHGSYVWGRTIEEASRHVEALETLLRAELALRGTTT